MYVYIYFPHNSISNSVTKKPHVPHKIVEIIKLL